MFYSMFFARKFTFLAFMNVVEAGFVDKRAVGCHEATHRINQISTCDFLLDVFALSRLAHLHLAQGVHGFSCLKKSLPLSSTRINAGKSSTVIFQMASMPSSGYSTHSMLLMLL